MYLDTLVSYESNIFEFLIHFQETPSEWNKAVRYHTDISRHRLQHHTPFYFAIIILFCISWYEISYRYNGTMASDTGLSDGKAAS
jgi:preprotein translocase subunit SecY